MSSNDDIGDPGPGLRVVDLSPPDKTRAQIEELRRLLPLLIANADVVAKIRRANFEALVRAGFTEAQALALCWR